MNIFFFDIERRIKVIRRQLTANITHLSYQLLIEILHFIIIPYSCLCFI